MPARTAYCDLNVAVVCRWRAARRASCSAWGRRVRWRGPVLARVQWARTGQAAQAAEANWIWIWERRRAVRDSDHPVLRWPLGQVVVAGFGDVDLVPHPVRRALGSVTRLVFIGRHNLLGGWWLVLGLAQPDLSLPDEVPLNPGASQHLDGRQIAQGRWCLRR